MHDYEAVRWGTEHFEANLHRLNGHLSADFAAQIDAIARHAGPLHVCLSRASHDDCASQTPYVIARFLSLAQRSFPDEEIGELIELLWPLMRWDYGMEELSYGLDRLCASDTPIANELARMRPDGIADLVDAVWRIGLWVLSYEGDLAERDVKWPLSRIESERGTMSAYESVAGAVGKRFEQLWRSLLGSAHDRERVLADRLWQNALVMAQRHKWLCDGQPQVFRDLLKHVADGGQWPLPCEANEEFKQRARGVGCEGFWEWNCSRSLGEPFALQVGFLSDPLEIVNIGNAFDTCLRLHGEEEAQILGWATNVNIRVVAAKGTDGRILARRTIGLSLDDEGVVRQCLTYPQGYLEMEKVIRCFVREFLEDADLDVASGGEVEDTCAPAYDADWDSA